MAASRCYSASSWAANDRGRLSGSRRRRRRSRRGSRVAARIAAPRLIEALKTRLDLVVVEAEIYLLRTFQTLLWALAALACALLAFVFIVVAVIAALWDTHRMAGVLGGAGLFAVLRGVRGAMDARMRMRR